MIIPGLGVEARNELATVNTHVSYKQKLAASPLRKIHVYVMLYFLLDSMIQKYCIIKEFIRIKTNKTKISCLILY